MEGAFDWIPFYEEFADKLLLWRDRQGELIAFLEELRAQGLKITPLEDQDENGNTSLLTEIDPFTFFGAFNRGILDESRIKILNAIKSRFAVTANTPTSFSGIPILNNQNSWYFAYKYARQPEDIGKLWNVFTEALKPEPLNNSEFAKAFDAALGVKYTNINLTIGLFWIRPRAFLNLDGTMRSYLNIKLPSSGLSFDNYFPILSKVKAEHPDFVSLSHDAYKAGKKTNTSSVVIAKPAQTTPIQADIDYWLVGAYWDSEDPADQTPRFLAEGVWENGYDDKFLDEVKSIRVGDKIAIKASKTQKHDLPFNSNGKTASVMLIKATGTVVKNPGDGKLLEVEWDPSPPEARNWYFYTGRATVWHLKKDDEYAQLLIKFVFEKVDQDYDFFVERWYGKPQEVATILEEIGGDTKPYGVADLIAEGVFLSEKEIEIAIRRLRSKKNLILQGAPGVGKTFGSIAQKKAAIQ